MGIKLAFAAAVCGTIIACALLQFTTLDGILGLIGGVTDTPVTEYAPRYTDKGFKAVRIGMPRDQVIAMLGQPLEETWDYDCEKIAFEWSEQVAVFFVPSCPLPKITSDATRSVVLRALGKPKKMVWMYSVSPDRSSYRERVIYLQDGHVVKKYSGMYFD